MNEFNAKKLAKKEIVDFMKVTEKTEKHSIMFQPYSILS